MCKCVTCFQSLIPFSDNSASIGKMLKYKPPIGSLSICSLVGKGDVGINRDESVGCEVSDIAVMGRDAGSDIGAELVNDVESDVETEVGTNVGTVLFGSKLLYSTHGLEHGKTNLLWLQLPHSCYHPSHNCIKKKNMLGMCPC